MGCVMIHIIVNSLALKGKKAADLDIVKGVFERAEQKYEIHTTEHKGHAKEITEKITSNGNECTIVAMGGDGTLHEIINGVKYPEKCSLGLIPFGTGNDFAAAAHIPTKVKDAAQIIAFRAPVHIDYIELKNGLRSINAVGMGIDCDVLKRTYSGKNKGKLKYIFACISSILHFKSYEFTADVDGVVSDHFGMLTCIGNGRQIGGGIKLFPNYNLSDGYMEFTMVDFVSKRRAFIEFINLILGKFKNKERITLTRAQHIKVTCKDPQFTIQAEGELYDNIPLDASIVHDKLSFFLPQND